MKPSDRIKEILSEIDMARINPISIQEHRLLIIEAILQYLDEEKEKKGTDGTA